MGDGDGTVTLASLKACQQFVRQEEDIVRSFRNIKHADVLKSETVFDFIKSVVQL